MAAINGNRERLHPQALTVLVSWTDGTMQEASYD